MTESLLVGITKDSILLVLKVAGPFLIASMVVGLIISIFQATTQIQEQTLTFVPKLIVICIIGLLLATWIIHNVTEFTEDIFKLIIQISS